jgi:hypothetical protein
MGEAPAAEAPVPGTPRAMEGAATRNLQRAPAPFPPCGAGASAVDNRRGPTGDGRRGPVHGLGRRVAERGSYGPRSRHAAGPAIPARYARDAITCLICV